MSLSWKEEYRRSLKSMDTEEHIDLAFYRPIGFMWAKLAQRLGVSPNAITIASIFLGIAAGVMFYYPALWINIIGMLLLIWANSFDSADGQLARMTKQYSRIGRILDGLSGDIWFATIYIAICLRENTFCPFFAEHPWIIWVTAIVTGICHAKQAAMADYYRQFHLYFLKGEDGSELDSAEELKRNLDESGYTWKNSFWKRLTMRTYLNYTLQQEATTPAMQQLRRELHSRFPDGRIPLSFRQAFRRESLPLMKYTNILSFNWRTIWLFVSLFIGQPWLYFIFELTLFNILAIYMIVRHESICRRFTNELRDGKY
ncbi:MAG: CDP-alcohol phosphatidyltransferase family protein [Duncaniella sp.]|nr:CDP-alcohol phosphatidyltransferase family protein [Duncaniella sp.]